MTGARIIVKRNLDIKERARTRTRQGIGAPSTAAGRTLAEILERFRAMGQDADDPLAGARGRWEVGGGCAGGATPKALARPDARPCGAGPCRLAAWRPFRIDIVRFT